MGTVGARHDWHSSKRVGHICLHQCEGVGTSFRILYLRILRSTCARGLFTGSFGQSALGILKVQYVRAFAATQCLSSLQNARCSLVVGLISQAATISLSERSLEYLPSVSILMTRSTRTGYSMIHSASGSGLLEKMSTASDRPLLWSARP